MNNEIHFGKKVKIYRTLSGCTQDEFANILLIARVSQSNIERTKLLSDISDDLLFRLYYLISKGKIDEEEYVSGLREDLLLLIENEICNRKENKKNTIIMKKSLTIKDN